MKKLIFFLFVAWSILPGLAFAAQQHISPIFLFFDARLGQASFYFSVENNGPSRVDRVVQLQVTDSGHSVRWAKYLSKVPKGGSYYRMEIPLQVLTGGGQIVVNAALYNKKQTKVLHVSPRYMVNLNNFQVNGEDSLFGMGDSTYHQILSENIDNIIAFNQPLNPPQSLTPLQGDSIFWKEVKRTVEVKAFQVTSTLPVNLGTNVTRKPKISLLFSEEVSPVSLNRKLFTLHRKGPKGDLIPVKGQMQVKGHELSFLAQENLWYESEYIAELKGEITSVSGQKYNAPYQWKFHTQKGETKAPPLLVMGNFPIVGEKKAGVHRQISLNFNKPLDLTWQDFQSFQVRQLTNLPEPEETDEDAVEAGLESASQGLIGRFIKGTVQVKERSVIFYPEERLAYGTKYQAILKKGLVGRLGHILRRDIVWEFTTIPKPEYAGNPLKIRRFFPAHREERISPAAAVEVLFEEDLASHSIEEDSILLLQEDQPIAGTITHEGNKLTFTPKELLKTGTSYRVTLSEQIKGRMGNPLLSGARWYFTIRESSDLPTSLDPGIQIRSRSHEQESYQQEEEGTFAFKITSENPLVKLTINGHALDVEGKHEYYNEIPYQLSGESLELEIIATTKQGALEKRYNLLTTPKPIQTSPYNMVVQYGLMGNDNINRDPPGSAFMRAQRVHFYAAPSYRGTFGDDFAMILALEFYVDKYLEPSAIFETSHAKIKLGLEFPQTNWGNQKFWLIGQDMRYNPTSASLPTTSFMQEVSLLWQIKKAFPDKAWRLVEIEMGNQNVKATGLPALDNAIDGSKLDANVTFGKSYKGFLTHLGFGLGSRTSRTGLGDLWKASMKTYLAYPIGEFIPSLRYRIHYTETVKPVPPGTTSYKWVNSLTRLKLAWQIEKSSELALVGQVEYQAGPPVANYQTTWVGLTYSLLY